MEPPMTIYHGSNIIVEKPELRSPIRTLVMNEYKNHVDSSAQFKATLELLVRLS
jgi:hypothetical protein